MNIQKEVIEEMAKYLGVTPQDIDLHASLSDDLELGPIELSDLLSALSEKFRITFGPEEIERLRTVNDLVELVEDLSLE
jgi:acyl carrier protein